MAIEHAGSIDSETLSPMPPELASHSAPRINLARYNLVSIRLVVLCAETGSLSKAAQRANMSLPRASQRLTTLESSLQATLFTRHPNGLRITAAGSVLASRGRELLRTIEELVDHLACASRMDS